MSDQEKESQRMLIGKEEIIQFAELYTRAEHAAENKNQFLEHQSRVKMLKAMYLATLNPRITAQEITAQSDAFDIPSQKTFLEGIPKEGLAGLLTINARQYLDTIIDETQQMAILLPKMRRYVSDTLDKINAYRGSYPATAHVLQSELSTLEKTCKDILG